MSLYLSNETLQLLKQFPPGTYEKFEPIEQQVKTHLLTLKTFLRGNKYSSDEIESKAMHFAIINVFLNLRNQYAEQSQNIYYIDPNVVLRVMCDSTNSIDQLYRQFLKNK